MPGAYPPDPDPGTTDCDCGDLSKCVCVEQPDKTSKDSPHSARQTPKVQPQPDMQSSGAHNTKPRFLIHWADQDGLIPVESPTEDEKARNKERPAGPGNRSSRATHDHRKEYKNDLHGKHQSRQRNDRHRQLKNPEGHRGHPNDPNGISHTDVDSHYDRPRTRRSRGHGDIHKEQGHDHETSSNSRAGGAHLTSQLNGPTDGSSHYKSPYAETVTDSSCDR